MIYIIISFIRKCFFYHDYFRYDIIIIIIITIFKKCVTRGEKNIMIMSSVIISFTLSAYFPRGGEKYNYLDLIETAKAYKTISPKATKLKEKKSQTSVSQNIARFSLAFSEPNERSVAEKHKKSN